MEWLRIILLMRILSNKFEMKTSSSFWLSVLFTSSCNSWLNKFLCGFFLQHFIYFRDSRWYHFLWSFCLCLWLCLGVHFWFCLYQLFVTFVECWCIVSVSWCPIFYVFFILFFFRIFTCWRFCLNFCLCCGLSFLFSGCFWSNLHILFIFIAPSGGIISVTCGPVIQVFFVLFFLRKLGSWWLSIGLYCCLYFIFYCRFCLDIFLIFIAPSGGIVSMTGGPVV